MRDLNDRPGRQARRFPCLMLGGWLLCAAAGAWGQAEGVSTETMAGEPVVVEATRPAVAKASAAGAATGNAESEAVEEEDGGAPVEAEAAPPSPFEAFVRTASEAFPHGVDLRRFYETFGFREAWTEMARVEALASALEGLEADGLVVEDYRPRALRIEHRQAHEERVNDAARWQAELAATRRLVLALRHLYHGKVDPVHIDADWEIPRPAFAPDWTAIAEAVAAGDPAAALALVRPDEAAYRQLRQGLARYRRLESAGGWGGLAARRDVLRPGDRAPEVMALRRRLAALGELELLIPAPPARTSTQAAPHAAPDEGRVYDARLVAAVKRFQRRHLLEVDGLVGPRTRAALSVGVAARVDQIRLNLERLRWLAHALPERYVLVDIAGYEVRYVRPDQPNWESRVVVGRPYRRTPTLRSAITHMTFHPTWTVPPTILREDVLPAIRRDPFYLMRHDMRVLDREGRPLDPWRVDWWQPGPIMVQQRAGPSNPLGEVVLRFPNRHLVYLHDTPSRELFERAQRPFSSGCIRVEGVRSLVRLLFEDDRATPGAPDGEAVLARALDRGRTHNVSLRTPVPLFLFYSTVRPGADGRLIFRPDVYERDAKVLLALDQQGGKNLFDAP